MKDEEKHMMKNYEVTLMATSYKNITVCSNSEKEALQMARDIYFNSSALDFTNDDVDEVAMQANEADDSEPIDEKYEQLTSELEDAIREAFLSNEDVKRAVQALMNHVQGERVALS